MQTFDVA